MKPYAFIQFEDDLIDGIDRVTHLIIMSGGNPNGFVFQQFDYLPPRLIDSFSKGFYESALQLGKGILVTVAQPNKAINPTGYPSENQPNLADEGNQ